MKHGDERGKDDHAAIHKSEMMHELMKIDTRQNILIIKPKRRFFTKVNIMIPF